MTDSVIVLLFGLFGVFVGCGGAPKGKPRKMCNAGGRRGRPRPPIVFPNEFILPQEAASLLRGPIEQGKGAEIEMGTCKKYGM